MSAPWRTTTIGDEMELVYGKSLPASARRPGQVPVFGSNGLVGYHDDACVDGPGVIVGRKGSVGAVTFSPTPFWPIDTTYYVRKSGHHNWHFLYYLLSSMRLKEQDSHSVVPGLNREALYSLTVAFPPREEQEKIAAILRLAQRAIEIEDKLIAAARELKQSAMRELFTRGLHGEVQKDTEIGPLPESWSISPVRSKARVIAGGTPSRNEARYWNAGTIPWVKTGEIDYRVITDTEEKITPEGLAESAAKLLPKDTVLVAMYGQGVTRGKVALLRIEAATNQACVGLIPLDGGLLPRFLYHYLVYSYERLRSLSHGAQQQNLNAELVGSFPVPLPQPAEQREIASILGAVDEKVSVHERKRAVLQDLFKTLLTDLMSGRIRVADLDIDVSEVTAA